MSKDLINKIIDSHIHFDDEQFENDRDILLDSFKNNNIEKIVNISHSFDTIISGIKLADAHENIFSAIGIHPDNCNDYNEKTRQLILNNITNDKVVAIGEIGLDYYHDTSNKDIQFDCFIDQLKIAAEYNMPVVIHSRDAAQDTMNILKKYFKSENKGVIHCYSYSTPQALEYIDMGFYIGIGGVVTFKNATKLKEVVKNIPLDSIVLETDAPYLAPTPHRGKRNSSLYIPLIAEEIADIKGIEYEEVINQAYLNTLNLYKRIK